VCARRAVLCAAQGDDATSLLEQALTLHADAGHPTPYWAVVRDCSPLVWQSEPPAALRQHLRALRAHPRSGVTMTRFKPSLTAELPTGWVAKESITLLAPTGTANVIASSEPLAPGIDLEEYAGIQGRLLREEFPGFEEHAFRREEFLGRQGVYLREFSWKPSDGQPVTQVQLYYAEPGRGYTATATTPSEHYPELALQLRQVLEGLLIEASGDRPPERPADPL
jgi:hypothetical protein